MGTQPVMAPPPESAKPKRVPPLTDAYRKAHKSYVLVAGLLAAWELVGLDPGKLGEKTGIVLNSPSGVPLILFTLMVYCGYKMVIEWVQCDPERRRNGAVKLEYRVAHLIAAGSAAVALIQYLAHISIANVLRDQRTAMQLVVSTAFLMISVRQVIRILRYGKGKSAWLVTACFLFVLIGFFAMASAIHAALGLGRNPLGWLLGIGGGLVIFIGFWSASGRLVKGFFLIFGRNEAIQQS